MRRTAVVVALAALAAARPAAAEPAAAKLAPAPVVGTGVIRGAVSFKGTAPARLPVRRDSDPVCAATEQLADDVVVTDGKLAGVVVRLANGSMGTWPAPTTPAVLSQTACAYRPRVLAVQAGQALAVDNGDPTYHNVRGVRGDATVFNVSQPAGAPRILRTDVGAAGEVLHLRCDVHPWMAADVVVHDHPFFAVTGEDGAFELRGVPPGRYTLEAWHPVLGLKQQKVTVGTGKRGTVKAAFAFKAARAPAAR
ncbi:MAG: hypothetical protein R2939_05495 [Kofleriaceae bacterium]